MSKKVTFAWRKSQDELITKVERYEVLAEKYAKLRIRLDEVIAFCEAPASTQEKADTQNAILNIAKGENHE